MRARLRSDPRNDHFKSPPVFIHGMDGPISKGCASVEEKTTKRYREEERKKEKKKFRKDKKPDGKSWNCPTTVGSSEPEERGSVFKVCYRNIYDRQDLSFLSLHIFDLSYGAHRPAGHKSFVFCCCCCSASVVVYIYIQACIYISTYICK